MRIGRTVPPAAAPLRGRDLWHGLMGFLSPERSLAALEEQVRRHFGVPHVFLLSSGTAALTSTLMALKASSSRTGVVIPAYTCSAVPAAVVRAGLRPVLCDIDPSTFDFDHASLERALDGSTLCVVAHHLFGIPSDVERLRAVCHGRGILVVEDAAQALGVEWRGRPLGTLGDVGVFSLGRGKAITCGSGGIIVTRSPRLAGALAEEYGRLRAPRLAETLSDLVQLALMTAFIRPRLYWIPAALPFLRLGETVFPREIRRGRLSGMKAALLHDWRDRLTRANGIRAKAAGYFSARLPLSLPCGPSHPYLRLPMLAASREDKARLHALSQARGLGLSVAYPKAVSDIPELAADFDGQPFPSARMVAERLVTIPSHGWLSDEDKQAILDCVAGAAPAGRPPWRQAS